MLTPVQSTELCAQLPDARLNKRFNLLVRQLRRGYRLSIPQATRTKGQTKGAYRFFRHKKIHQQDLIQASAQKLSQTMRASGGPYLCLSDSTELDYTGKRSAANLGPLTYKKRRGMIAHNSMVISEKGVPKGLLNQSFILRNEDYFGQADQRRHWPIERKESHRWLRDFQQMQQLSRALSVPIIFVADREADIMEIFHARTYEQAHFIIRSQYNRRVYDRTDKLYEVLRQQEFVHTYHAKVRHPKTRKQRTATLKVRFVRLRVELSSRCKAKKHLQPTPLYAVEVCECDPPADVEEPIHWVLLTSLAVRCVEDAMRVIRAYMKRWIIERFHYLLKSGGVKVEELQIEGAQALQNAITTYSIAVMDAMKIKYAAQNHPEDSVLAIGVTAQQCQLLYTYIRRSGIKDVYFDPQKPPTAWEFCRVLGLLGGFIPSKRQPLPGLKILSRALEQLFFIIQTVEVMTAQGEMER